MPVVKSITKTLLAMTMMASFMTTLAWSDEFDVSKISTNLELFSFNDEELSERGLQRTLIGRLELPDGQLAAFDPLVQPDRPAFEKKVTPGDYPVEMIIEVERYGTVVAGIIRFSDETISAYELALLEGQDVSALEEDYFFGFPVDAGLGAFANSAYLDAEALRIEKEKRRNSSFSNYYDDVLYKDLPGEAAGEHVLHKPMMGHAGTAAIMHSGWGDGYYPVIWALNANNEPVAAMIDFFVIENANAEGAR